MTRTKLIVVSAIGLLAEPLYIAHEFGNWGPEMNGSDHLEHPMALSEDEKWFICDGDFLDIGEEFKIVAPNTNHDEAVHIYGLRVSGKVHVNIRLDYDLKHEAFWLLAESHSVIRPEKWNQNNVYS